MSRYGYDFSPTPSPNGWRSVFRNILVIGTIAGISAISGGVVALDLLGSGSAVNRPVVATRQVPPSVARIVTPPPSQPASAPKKASAAVQQPPATVVTATTAAARPSAQPSTTPAPQATSARQPAPAPAAAPVEEPKTAHVPDRELTFSSGYARRRAVQEAATAGSGAKIEMARMESQTQVGRAATKARPRATVARQNAPQDQSGAYARFDQPNKFDFARHQALALGDSRDRRADRRPPQQQGGLFGGGFFRGMF